MDDYRDYSMADREAAMDYMEDMSDLKRDLEREEAEAREAKLDREEAAAEADSFYFHFAPGYVTEMDFLNSLEADDYMNEGEEYEF